LYEGGYIKHSCIIFRDNAVLIEISALICTVRLLTNNQLVIVATTKYKANDNSQDYKPEWLAEEATILI